MPNELGDARHSHERVFIQLESAQARQGPNSCVTDARFLQFERVQKRATLTDRLGTGAGPVRRGRARGPVRARTPLRCRRLQATCLHRAPLALRAYALFVSFP